MTNLETPTGTLTPAQAVNGIYAALSGFDVPAFSALLDRDIEWIEPLSPGFRIGGTYRGVDAVLAALGPIPTEWDRFAFTVDEVIEIGPRVLALGSYNLRARQTGIEADVPFAHLFQVAGGRVTRLQVYSDRGNLIAALSGPA